jgi:hypothetical protein
MSTREWLAVIVVYAGLARVIAYVLLTPRSADEKKRNALRKVNR